MLSLGEHDTLLYIMCTLYVLCHKDYYTVYISERRIRKQDTQLKETSVERKDLLFSVPNTILLLSQIGRCPSALYTYIGQTWVFSPNSYGSQDQTAAQYSHLGCYTPRHYMTSLTGQTNPVLKPAKPWVYHCKPSMIWENYKSYMA